MLFHQEAQLTSVAFNGRVESVLAGKEGRLSLFPGSLTLVPIVLFFNMSFEVWLFIFSILIFFYLFVYYLHHVAWDLSSSTKD